MVSKVLLIAKIYQELKRFPEAVASEETGFLCCPLLVSFKPVREGKLAKSSTREMR